MSADQRPDELERHLTQCLVEEVALVNGGRAWRVVGGNGNVGDPVETYEVDEDIDEGPVVLVRQSDGARFDVDVSVSVAPAVTRS